MFIPLLFAQKGCRRFWPARAAHVEAIGSRPDAATTALPTVAAEPELATATIGSVRVGER
jgi:hypothetical protein